MDLRGWPGFRLVFGGLAAVAFVIFVVWELAAPVKPQPAMWLIRDADSTIYLLGTFHLVKPGTEWRTPKIASAFDAADEVWLEASMLANPAKLQALVLKHGFDRRHPLSSKLTSEALARLDEVVQASGLQRSLLEPMRPWLAALTISVAPLTRAGYDPRKGVDQVLEADTRTAHKTLKTFETAEQQLMIFAGLSEEEEVGFLTQSLMEAGQGMSLFDTMSEEWLSGDIEALNESSFAAMKQNAPALYDAMIVQRNIAWSKKIAAIMQGSGTSFIAVGAGHLTGDDSVQALLAERGFTVERY